MFLTKKWFFTFLAFVFLLVSFIDQNNVPVPVKFFVIGPYQIPLSLIIGVSLITGIALTLAVGYVIYRQLQQSRLRKTIRQKKAA